jgi:hypothetical protein
MSAPFP